MSKVESFLEKSLRDFSDLMDFTDFMDF